MIYSDGERPKNPWTFEKLSSFFTEPDLSGQAEEFPVANGVYEHRGTRVAAADGTIRVTFSDGGEMRLNPDSEIINFKTYEGKALSF